MRARQWTVHREGITSADAIAPTPGVTVTAPASLQPAEVVAALEQLVAVLAPADRREALQAVIAAALTAATPCPRCASRIIQRQGRHGPFLGCTAWPRCDWTAAIPDDAPSTGRRP